MFNVFDLPKLSEFAKKYENAGYIDPLCIIKRYIIETNQEYEFLDMIKDIAKARAEKAENQLNYARSWIPNEIDMKKANRGMTVGQAQILSMAFRLYCLGMSIPKDKIDILRKTVEEIDEPDFIFVPMVDWLKKEYGIRFKDDIDR